MGLALPQIGDLHYAEGYKKGKQDAIHELQRELEIARQEEAKTK